MKLGGYVIWNKIIKVTLLREGRLSAVGLLATWNINSRISVSHQLLLSLWGHGFRTRITLEANLRTKPWVLTVSPRFSATGSSTICLPSLFLHLCLLPQWGGFPLLEKSCLEGSCSGGCKLTVLLFSERFGRRDGCGDSFPLFPTALQRLWEEDLPLQGRDVLSAREDSAAGSPA